jgi:hypothetical protein
MAERELTASPAASTEHADAADSERKLGRAAAIAIPLLSVGCALAAGISMGVGLAVLVLVGGALLGAVALLWASLRTLTGDAPLPVEMESVSVRWTPASDREERKRRVLRALKDLEQERKLGKIDEADYQDVAATYREEAKELLREQDAEIEPYRAKAEELARSYLAKRGLGERGEPDADGHVEDAAARPKEEALAKAANTERPAVERRACPKCETSNESDAAFCKKCGRKLATEDDAT